MTEQEELRKLNEGLKAVKITVDRIEGALLGDEFNKNGIIPRLDKVEAKQRKLDTILTIVLTCITFGSYPFLREIVSEYIKTR